MPGLKTAQPHSGLPRNEVTVRPWTLVEVAGLDTALFFDKTQRDERKQKATRIAGSMGIVRLAEIDRSNKIVRAGLKYAKSNALSPITRAQAASALEAREDPVRQIARDLSDSMQRARKSEPLGIWTQQRTMSRREFLDYTTDQMDAYKPRNVLSNGGIAFPGETPQGANRYNGKIVILSAKLSQLSFVSAPYAVFVDAESGKSFNAYEISSENKVLRFGDRFFLIGKWTNKVRPNDTSRLPGIHVHKICGISIQQQSSTANVLCETLVQPGK